MGNCYGLTLPSLIWWFPDLKKWTAENATKNGPKQWITARSSCSPLLSCHGETLGNKEAYDRPPAHRGLCGYELLYTKQLNQEQCEGLVGRRTGGGGGVGEVEGRPVQIRWSSAAEDLALCVMSASQILITESDQVGALYINTTRYIRPQSLSICCSQRAAVVLKHQSPSGSFQVSSSRASYMFPDVDFFSASRECTSPPMQLNIWCPAINVQLSALLVYLCLGMSAYDF